MGKRRTRKQKETAKHLGVQNAFQPVSYTYVKSQIIKSSEKENKSASNKKNAERLGNELDLGSIKKDLAKSLIFSILILGTIMMIYLAW